MPSARQVITLAGEGNAPMLLVTIQPRASAAVYEYAQHHKTVTRGCQLRQPSSVWGGDELSAVTPMSAFKTALKCAMASNLPRTQRYG